MHVVKQIRIVFWSVAAAALLLAADAALAASALRNLSALETRMISQQQLDQVRLDLLNNLLTASAGAITVGVLVLFARRPNNRFRIAIWLIAPLLGMALLCVLVGGPEWAVTPTGSEPDLLQREYEQVVPDWYVTAHGITALCAAGLLFFVAGFVTRTDLREYYLDTSGNGDYRSWVDRTGG